MPKTITTIYTVLILVLASSITLARTVGDVNVPDQTVINGENLVLNGCGMREKFFFDIYVAALYLAKPAHSTETVLAMPGSRRILMHFVYSEIGRDKLIDAWNEGFEDNLTRQELASLKSRVDQFNSLFGAVHRGDVIWLDYTPDSGTTVTINGQEKGRIPGQDFNNALLRIWLGKEPVTGSLKQDLLGQ